MNAFVVINVVKRCAQVSHHERVRSENGGRHGRGSIDRKEGADSGELVADFFFLDIKEASDVLNHLFVGERQFIAGRTVWRRGGYDVGSVASAVSRGRGAGWNENGGRGARHCWTIVWYV